MQTLAESMVLANQCSLRWHLIFTKPNAEQTAKANLERQGYRVYYPRLHRKILRRGAWSETISALFPRYIFVQLNAAMQSLAPLRSTRGVTGVVRFGAEYITVSEKIVCELINREDRESGLHRLALGPSLKGGEAVRVIEGAFAGLEGVFEREDANDRVVILLSLLGQAARVRLPMVSVVPNTLMD